jgi:uncharacterized membrane protein YphA (DoxX/SURF4 family)
VDVVVTAASVVLGLCFLIAGGSKLAARDSWPVQARGLGAPQWVIPIVPWVELSLGAALVVQLGRRGSALVSIALLVAFSALIARRLRQGQHPPCACFGAWSATPIGPRHLLRNAVLIAIGCLALM